MAPRDDGSTAGRRLSWAAAAASVAFALTVTMTPTAAVATPPPSVPTPQDIQNAKRNEAAKQAEIAKITALLVQYQNASDLAQRAAQTASEQVAIAQQNLDAATQTANQLAIQQQIAEKQASASRKRAAAIIAQLARTGGGDVTLGLISGSGAQADQLLERLGSMNRLTTTAQQILQRAQYDRNAATSLARQASVAQAKRASLATAAEAAAAASQQAAASASAQVASAQASQSTMYAQLAELKGTTAALEQQAAVAAQLAAAQQAAAAAASRGSSSGSGGSGSGGSSGSGSSAPPKGVDPTPPPPSSNAVATAIAFAKAQLGKPYVDGGEGPNVWDCSGLVMKAYAAAGVSLGPIHGSTSQYRYLSAIGRLVDRRTAGIQAGDLLFYSDGGASGVDVTKYHVTMAIGGGLMIEAPYPGVGVRIVAIRTLDLVPYVGRPTG